MTSQPWIPGRLHGPRLRICSFNGAMTSQPWIQASTALWHANSLVLQWSHDLSAMDTCARTTGSKSENRLQWSHDLSAMDTTEKENDDGDTERASMEP